MRYDPKFHCEKSYGGKCAASEACRDDLGLQCTNGTCACHSLEVWDAYTYTCQPEVISCTISADECGSNGLSCIEDVCACHDTEYWDTSDPTSLCKPKKLYSAACSASDQCRTDLGLTCLNSLCVCSNTDFWDLFSSNPSGDLFSSNPSCQKKKSFNESCSFSCECDMDDGLVCTADGSCQCGNYMLEYWDSGCKTKIYNGLPCELTSQCRTDLQLVCFGDRQQVCQCPSGMYFGESLLLPQCVNRPSVGEPCSDSVPCETGVGLTCVVKKKIQFCGCDQNYQWDKNVMSCHKSPSFGEPCSNSLPCKTGVGLSCAGDKETQFCGCDQNYQWDEDVMSCQRSPSFDEPCSNSFPCKTGVGLTCAGEKETQFCGCDQNYQWHEDAMSCQKSPSFDEQCSNSLPCKTGVGLSCAGEKETQFCGCDENYQWDKDVMSCQKSPSFDEQCSNSLPCKTGVGLSCAGDKETQFCGCGQNYQWDETALSCQENSVVDIEMIAVASSGVLVFLIVLVFVTIVVIKKRKDFRTSQLLNLDCCCTETPKDVQPPLDIPQYASLHLNISDEDRSQSGRLRSLEDGDGYNCGDSISLQPVATPYGEDWFLQVTNIMKADASALMSWKNIGRRLDIEEADIVDIDHQHSSLKEKLYQVLLLFKDNHKLASKEFLITVLLDEQCIKCAGEIADCL